MANEDKPAASRRRVLVHVAWMVLLGALLAWRFWTGSAPVEAPPAPGWPSPLDVLDPTRLADDAWSQKDRPAEAVGILDLSHDADNRLKVSIAEGVVLIKNVRDEEVIRIDAYAPPKPPEREGGGAIVDPRTGQIIALDQRIFMLEPALRLQGRDEHRAMVAALSPKADRLVVLARTEHIAGRDALAIGSDANGSGEWAQVWRWEGGMLTPLEAQPLEGFGAHAAAFSADGKLLATSSYISTDIWEVGDKKLKHLGKIAGGREQLLFAPDGRSLAVINRGSFALYDLGPILLPGEGGWARWRFLWAALAGGGGCSYQVRFGRERI
jgi:hypothetical protein